MSVIEDNLLTCTSSVLSERVEAYNIITRKLSSQHLSIAWGEKISTENVKKIITNVKLDIFCKEDNIAFETTGFLGCFLANERLMDCLSVEEEQETFDSLMHLLKTCDDKKILNRALWSFAQSKFGCDIYSKNINDILILIKEIMGKEQHTSITRYEGLQVIKSLLESSPKNMIEEMDIWFPLVFNGFFHETARVRGVAYSCMLICKNMQQIESIDMIYSHLLPFLPDLKNKYCKVMLMLIDEDCVFIFKIWRLIVTLLGKHLHPGTGLINKLLEVVEKAFKSSRPECRVDAFKCWQVLITNFALDCKVINHPKRMKLLSAPFKSNNVKTEEIANAKLVAWWHFVVALDDRCSDHFEIVVVPLLKYCFHPKAVISTNGFDQVLMSGALGSSSPARKYKGLHIKSIEMLAAILNNDSLPKTQNYSLSIPEPTQNIITCAVFLRNFQLLFSCMCDALQLLNESNPKQFSLGLMILSRMAQHVKDSLLFDCHKKECVEMIKELVHTTTVLETANDSSNSFLLKFMTTFIIGELALPSSVMNSRQHNVPVGSKPQELVIGTLNNFFIHKLLKPSLLVHKNNEIYKRMWDELLHKSKPACGKLSFFEFTLEELSNAAPILCPDSLEIFVDVWMQTCSHLYDYIQQENTIDQGDSSDHEWRCMYKYFLFTIKHCHDHLAKIEDSSNYQRIIGMQGKLWTVFTALCSLTSTAEPNSEADFICKDMISLLTDKYSGPPDAIYFTLLVISELIYIIIGQFRFRDLGKTSIKAVQSPARAKKKPHVLHNIGGCIDLLCIVMEKATRIIGSSRGKIMAKVAMTAVLVCKNIPKKYAWHFISSFCDVLRKAILINPSAKYTPEVEVLVVDMWNEYILCWEKHIGKNISADQLAKLSPILIAGLSSSHDLLKQKTRTFWYNNYASRKVAIPANLYAILKSNGLPPASISDVLTESQDTFHKSPAVKSGKMPSKDSSSPVVVGQTTVKSHFSPSDMKKTPKSVKKSIFEMKDEDFVKISSPTVNKRLLTSHQAEKMKSRGGDIPALYSDLSQSMSHLPPGFSTQESFDQSSTENNCRSKQLFPPIEQWENSMKKEKKTCIESVPSSKGKKSPSKKYSEKNANEILKDTSLKLEKSLSPLEKSSSLLDPTACEEKENRSDRKRKCSTPSKKSIADVRKSLKGSKFLEMPLFKEKSCKAKDSPAKKENVSQNETLSHVDKSAGKTNEVIPDSDEEIPCSQIDGNLASKSIISKIGIESPGSTDRPKRNKRKYFDDGLYITPIKKVKLTPMEGVACEAATTPENVPNSTSKRIKLTPMRSDATELKITEFNTPIRTPKKNVNLETVNTEFEMTKSPQSKNIKEASNKDVGSEIATNADVSTHNTKSTKLNTSTDSNKSGEEKSNDLSTSDSSSGGIGAPSSTGRKRGRGRPKAFKPHITEVQKLYDNFDYEPKMLGSPTKVTRSGRRIVAPKKELDLTVTPLSHKKEGKKLPPKGAMSLTKRSDKASGSPLASPIVSPEKVPSTIIQKKVFSPTEKMLSNSILQAIEPKGDFGNVKPNRKLFNDSPKRDSCSDDLKIDNDVRVTVPKSPTKSPSRKRQALERNVNVATTLKELDIIQLIEKSPSQPLIPTNKYSSDDSSDNEVKLNNGKRKRVETTLIETNKANKISKNYTDSQEPSQSDCKGDANKEKVVSIEDKDVRSMEPITVLEKKIIIDDDKKKDDSIKNQHATEDENMNMVKELSAEKGAIESPKPTGPTSFSGLINKENSTNKKKPSPENSPKPTTAIWPPSISASNSLQPLKENCNGKLPYIYVRKFGSDGCSSPIRKTKMLVLGQSPSSPIDKTIQTVMNSPASTENTIKPGHVVAVSDGKLGQEPTTAIENVIKQESPLRLSHSRLSNTISTPEVHQMRKQKIHHRSRAAAMLACAQEAMKNKSNETQSPRSFRFSRGSKYLPNGNSPLVARKSAESASPWARFEPSPNASPSSGILKRYKLLDEDSGLTDSDFETSPCLTKSRRVSFAYPVYESIEIPPSPKVLKNIKAQKKLDMTKSCQAVSVVKEAMPLKEVNKEDRILDSLKPIYPELSSCQDPLEDLITKLAQPGMTKGLSILLKTSSVNTVGDMAQLTESELHMFPVQSPKTERTLECLKNFAKLPIKINLDDHTVTVVNDNQSETSTAKVLTKDDIDMTTESSAKLSEDTERHISDVTDEELLQEMSSRLEKNTTLIDQFCNKVSQAKKQEIFESLLTCMPYASVIDIYHDFLKNKFTS